MKEIHPMPERENRRKRAIYRAEHRGTKELDMLLGQFAHWILDEKASSSASETDMTADERLAVVEWLIAQPDHALQPWLINGETAPLELPGLVRMALQQYQFEVQEWTRV